MTATTLSEAQRDAAHRLGRTAGMLALAETKPDSLTRVPPWVKTCLRLISETIGPGAGRAVASADSPYAAGLVFGNLGTMVSLITRPEERCGESQAAWLNAYLTSVFETMTGGTASMPADLWGQYAQLIFGSFVALGYDERHEFIDGMIAATDFERKFRAEPLREVTATRLYIEMLLFWPEIQRMKSLAEVHSFLGTRFEGSSDAPCDFERLGKLADRIELRFPGGAP